LGARADVKRRIPSSPVADFDRFSRRLGAFGID